MSTSHDIMPRGSGWTDKFSKVPSFKRKKKYKLKEVTDREEMDGLARARPEYILEVDSWRNYGRLMVEAQGMEATELSNGDSIPAVSDRGYLQTSYYRLPSKRKALQMGKRFLKVEGGLLSVFGDAKAPQKMYLRKKDYDKVVK